MKVIDSQVIKDLEFVQTVIFAIHYSDNFAENARKITIKERLEVNCNHSHFCSEKGTKQL